MKARRSAGLRPTLSRLDHGVEVQLRNAHEIRVDHDGYQTLGVIDDGKRGQRTWIDAQYATHLGSRCEPDAAASADAAVQGFEIDRSVFMGHDDEQAPFLVLQQEILREGAGHLPTQCLSLLDGAVRRIGRGWSERDTKFAQHLEQTFLPAQSLHRSTSFFQNRVRLFVPACSSFPFAHSDGGHSAGGER